MKRSQWGENLSQVVVFGLFVDNDVTKFISSSDEPELEFSGSSQAEPSWAGAL